MVNGCENIFYEKDGRITRWRGRIESEERLNDIIQQIVAKVNRSVNMARPICDARLEDGSRFSTVLSPIALDGASLTIRKFSGKPMDMAKLVDIGALSHEAEEVLKTYVQAGYNILVSGGTGSGKTTFLNALSGCIPNTERVITIEDAAELRLQGIENLVRLETRAAGADGQGEISIRDLIKAALRMRPDRIIVGEVRDGGAALDMVIAMNTGHDGSLSTIHSNSAYDCIGRLETLLLTVSDMPLEAIRRQIASAVDIIVHLGRMRDKSRKVVEIMEVGRDDDGGIVLNRLYGREGSECQLCKVGELKYKTGKLEGLLRNGL